jgi:hypothetical protein
MAWRNNSYYSRNVASCITVYLTKNVPFQTDRYMDADFKQRSDM